MPDFNRLAKTLLWGGVLLALCCLFAHLLARAKPFGDRAPRSIAAAPRATAPQSIIGLPEEDIAPAPKAREAPLPKSALFTQKEMEAMPEARRHLLRALLSRPTP